ncbi:MAG: trimethylamine methyltransferase family protein [Alphaproteobacteria bacterium]|nr:trimethylamine methyltransferase family protein [Alphaproteobacteria bacterium]
MPSAAPALGADFGWPVRRPGFAYLDDERVEELRRRAIAMLDRHGVVVNHPEAVAKLGAAGCKLDTDGRRVRIPPELTEQAVRLAPRAVSLCGKDERHDLRLPRGDGTFWMRTGTGAHGYIEPDTGDYRKLRLEDVRTIAALSGALSEVGFVAHPFVNDVPEVTADIHGLGTLLAHSVKHVWIQPYGTENIAYLLRLAALAAGGEAELRARPIASCIVCSFTPLEFKAMDVEAVIQCSRFGVPIHACSLPTAGGTAPVTMPGTVLMATAEILAMVVLAHVLGPGTPVIATPLIFCLDMRSGRSLQSSVEALAGASMAVQVMKRGCGLPTHTYGAGSDTPDIDGQSQAERALIAFLVGLAGADVLGGVGQLECATVFSPVQAVIDNEIGAMARSYLRTPAVDDESLAWGDLLQLDPGGNFLATEHTLRHCRTGFAPAAFTRQARDAYDAGGRRDLLAQARDMLAEILRTYPPQPVVDAPTRAEMQRVVTAADAKIAG